MISTLQAILLGLIQGFTELFPISSLGHSIIIPQLIGWDVNQNDPYFLNFLVATHVSTTVVLLIVFWDDWRKLYERLMLLVKKGKLDTADTYTRLGLLLIVGTIPAGLLGLFFQDAFEKFFKAAEYVAFFLFLNGIILLFAERMRTNNERKFTSNKESDKEISKLRWSQALLIGSSQALALFPGISRSGSAMAGGLLAGLNNENAARFSFMLGTPIIAAAGALKIPELFAESADPELGAILCGSLAAGFGAYFSLKFMLRYFQTRTLTPFAIYCLLSGAAASIYLWLN